MSASTAIAAAILLVGALGAYMLYTGQLQNFLPISVEGIGGLDIIGDAETQIGEGAIPLTSNGEAVDYPTLVPNPRWNHMPIKVYMDTSSGEGLDNFGEDDVEFVRQALKVWEEKTDGVVSFEEVGSLSEGEVIISWFPSLSDIKGGRVVGEGGPTRAIETGGIYTLIEAGEIFLIPTDSKCVGVNRPVHEMGHVLGLGHAPPGYGDIMYSREISCSQNITQITSDAIMELYREPAAPDLIVSEISAVKRGGQLDVNLTVKNIGLERSVQTSLGFFGDGEEISSLSVPRFSVIPAIEPGSGIKMSVTRASVPSGMSELSVVADSRNSIAEMSESNNEVTVTFKPA